MGCHSTGYHKKGLKSSTAVTLNPFNWVSYRQKQQRQQGEVRKEEGTLGWSSAPEVTPEPLGWLLAWAEHLLGVRSSPVGRPQWPSTYDFHCIVSKKGARNGTCSSYEKTFNASFSYFILSEFRRPDFSLDIGHNPCPLDVYTRLNR